MEMKISIVTPCYQAGAFLAETIESVLSQGYGDYEYWIVDAGSTDATMDIIRSYQKDKRIHFIGGPDSGQSNAINKGLQQCSGGIFNWLNADDALLPGALERVVEAFQKKSVDIVAGRMLEFSESGPKTEEILKLPVRSCAEQTICRGVFCQPSTFWKTAVVRELGGVEEQLQCMMDWHLWVKYLALHGQSRVVLIPEVLARFRKHDAAKSAMLGERFHQEGLAIYRKLVEDLGIMDEVPLIEEELGGVVAPVHLPEFRFSKGFSRDAFLAFYCDRVTGRLYNKQEMVKSLQWWWRGFQLKRLASWWRLRMLVKLLLAKIIRRPVV